MKFEGITIKKNLIIYSINFLTVFFTYIFIILCLNLLDKQNIYYFTGFIAILNILTIPLSSLSIGLSRIKEKIYVIEKSNILSFIFYFSAILLILNFIIHNFFNFKNIFYLKENHIYLIILIFFFHSFFSIKISEILKKNKYELFAFFNFIPFLIRTILILIIYFVYDEVNIYSVLFVYLLSFFIFKNYELLNKVIFFNFLKKKSFFLKRTFLVNFISMSIIAIILNVDILTARTMDLNIANEYYIASLFGKVILISSLFLMPYIYKLELKLQNEFYQIIFYNFIINILIIFFYLVFIEYVNILFFPNEIIDKNNVIRVSFFYLLFSISLNLSNRVILKTYHHLILKVIIIFIFLMIISYEIITINILLNYFTILSIIFLTIDIGFYLKTFLLNKKYKLLKS